NGCRQPSVLAFSQQGCEKSANVAYSFTCRIESLEVVLRLLEDHSDVEVAPERLHQRVVVRVLDHCFRHVCHPVPGSSQPGREDHVLVHDCVRWEAAYELECLLVDGRKSVRKEDAPYR